MKTFGKALILLNTLLCSAYANDEVLRFKKCYTLFVREVLPSNQEQLLKVKSGSLSGTEACMELFDKGVLGDDDEIKKDSKGAPNYEGTRVLRTFLGLHQTFFQEPDYYLLLSGGERLTAEMIDTNEPAYHMTYAALKKAEPYHKMITGESTLKAIRDSNKSKRTKRTYDFGAMNFYYGDYASGTQLIPWEPSEVVESGTLVGITPQLHENPAPTLPGRNAPYSGYDINRHFGGGVIGSQAYLMANTGLVSIENLKFQDGGLNLKRRWGKRVFSDVLCRELPVLRNSDVVSEVNMDSELPFRKGISCMGCHKSMDPMTGAIRNLATVNTGRGSIQGSTVVKYFIKREPDMGSIEHPVLKGNANYYRTPSDANLTYRSYDGKLIHQEVSDLQGLGEAIAEQNDLYACAAKRYYKFLTGIDSDLSDIGNINSPKYSDSELAARNKVIQLGLELKKHQSIRSLLQSIIQSKTFLNPASGV